MSKIKSKKIIILIVTVIVLAGFSFWGTYKYNRLKDYNMLIDNGNKYMGLKEYDKAISLFEQSLNYKKDPNIEKTIVLANKLKKFKEVYDNGIKLMNDKKYLEAIEKFKTINKEGLTGYFDSQKKIEECKKQFIAQNIKLANDAAKSNKYDKANKYLDDILKLDSNNADVKNLKDKFAKEVKEQKERDKAIKEQQLKEQAKESNSQGREEDPLQNNNAKNNSQYNEYAMQIELLEREQSKIDIELTHLYKNSDAYINKLREKQKLLYQQKEIIKKMQSISGN